MLSGIHPSRGSMLSIVAARIANGAMSEPCGIFIFVHFASRALAACKKHEPMRKLFHNFYPAAGGCE